MADFEFNSANTYTPPAGDSVDFIFEEPYRPPGYTLISFSVMAQMVVALRDRRITLEVTYSSNMEL